MKKTQLGLILGLTSTLATLTAITPAHSFTWTINATSTNPNATISGSFTINDESLGAGATVTASNITLGSVTYGTTGVSLTGAGSVTGISWSILAPDGGCLTSCDLNLNFDGAGLTTAGGIVTIASGTSFSQNFADPSELASNGGTTFAGGATATANVTGRVPFNFSTTPGLIVLGLIVGGGKGKKHLPKIKKKIASLLSKK